VVVGMVTCTVSPGWHGNVCGVADEQRDTRHGPHDTDVENSNSRQGGTTEGRPDTPGGENTQTECGTVQ
jgi:hypothetical protein